MAMRKSRGKNVGNQTLPSSVINHNVAYHVWQAAIPRAFRATKIVVQFGEISEGALRCKCLKSLLHPGQAGPNTD